LLQLAIAAALAGPALPASAQHHVTAPQIDATRVLLPRGVYTGAEPGATLLHDYGAFQLWRVDAAHAAELAAVAGGPAKTAPNRIEFEAAPFDPAAGTPDVPAAFRAGKHAGPYLQVVQFVGPTVDAWLDAVRATGANVVQYVPNHAYVVLGDEGVAARLAALAQRGDFVQYAAPLEPFNKLNHRLAQRARGPLAAGKPLRVDVLVAAHAGNGASKAAVRRLARDARVGEWADLRGVEALRVTIDEADLATLAQLPDVVGVEDYVPPRKLDEVQSQIVAGNLTGDRSGPSGTGYLAFLAELGFSTNPADYPIVDVADDGLGNGNAAQAGGDPTLRVGGDAAGASRVLNAHNCTADASGDGVGGHGHLNTNIVGGYDARAGFPFRDPNGYQRGLGLNPYARLAHTKIFANSGGYDVSACSNTDQGVIKRQQDGGAVISSNSWGAPVGGDYDDSSRAYDIGTRDADGGESGLQPMTFVFAAGNSGPGAQTVGSPGTAKNVITVGASENKRESDESGPWTDGCAVNGAGANNAMDVIGFSSRGPAQEGGSTSSARIKPEVIAPGTHVHGTASTSPAFDGSGVCDQFRPGGQTVFAASSGTSHSTPAIAGVASLVHRYLQTNYADAAPSAAAIKAYLIAHPTYLTGVSANDTLPSNAQGYGMPNLGAMFDAATFRAVRDQTDVLGATGATYTWTGAVADTGKPLRVALAWSDAPGATSADPKVNNLDLTVQVGATTYRGNRFSGQWSTTGGTADANNNYEAVYLPSGTSGNVTVTVTASNVAGDGVPGNADTTDQDFALVCSNCVDQPEFTFVVTPGSAQTCGASGATFTASLTGVNGYNQNVTLEAPSLPSGATAAFDPPALVPSGTSTVTIGTAGLADGGYTLTLRGTDGTRTHADTVTLTHSVALPTAAALATPADGTVGAPLAPTLAWNAVAGALDYTVEVDDDPAFGSVNYTATVTTTTHTLASALNQNTRYYWRVRVRNTCGTTDSTAFQFVTNVVACQTIASTDVPKTIGPGTGQNAESTLTSAVAGTIQDVDVIGLAGTHTWINDVSVQLRSPAGTTATIMARSCGSQDNFNLSLDDAAPGNPGGWPCPPTGGGTYKPSAPLATLNGGPASGTWQLTVRDNVDEDGGSLNAWSLRICGETAPPQTVDAIDDAIAATEDQLLTVGAPGVLGNDTPNSGLTASVVTPPASGALAMNANGSFTYTPAPNFCGSVPFVYAANDGPVNDQATATIDVACVNDAPSADDDAYVATEDQALTIAAPGVLTNDTDVEASTLTAINATSPTSGSVTLGSDGSLTYTPVADYCNSAAGGAPATFTYQANDGQASSTPAAVGLTVTCVNDAPRAVGTIPDQRIAIGGSFDLATAPYFTDVEMDTLTYSATGLPANLAIDPATGRITGTATATGTVSVTVTATDPSMTTTTQTFSLEVAGDMMFRDGFE
jgi:subtilisin-like proprotein convertase family protein